jgi:hypothetical protein
LEEDNNSRKTNNRKSAVHSWRTLHWTGCCFTYCCSDPFFNNKACK